MLLELGRCHQETENLAARRISKVICAKDDCLAAFAKLWVQGLVGDYPLKGQVERDETETVHLWAKVGSLPVRMLKVLVTCLATVTRRHSRNKHSVIVDQSNSTLRHHHVA